MIELAGVSRSYGAHPAVRAVDLRVAAGAFLCIVGPSGSGKSTLLRLIAGLDEPTAGEIRIAGRTVAAAASRRRVAPQHRSIGFVFQDFALWPHMSVAAHVDWPLRLKGLPAAERAARVDQVLALNGLSPLAGRYPAELSGGERQRTAIARALAPGPNILLFDEPFSNLDVRIRGDLRRRILDLHRASGTTSILVTHDQGEALAMATDLAVLDGGRVHQAGPPDALLARPATPFVAAFLGTPPGNLIPADVRDGRLWALGRPVAPARDVGHGGRLRLHYRPERLSLGPADDPDGVGATVVERLPAAGRWMLRLDCAAGVALQLIAEADCPAREGDRVTVRIPDHPDSVFAGQERLP